MVASPRVPSPPRVRPPIVRSAAPSDVSIVTESQVMEIIDLEVDPVRAAEILELSATDLAIEAEPDELGPAASMLEIELQSEAPAVAQAPAAVDEALQAEDDAAWAARIADAKADAQARTVAPPAPAAAPCNLLETRSVSAPIPVCAPAPPPRHVPSDRMRAVEALSTIKPWVSSGDSMLAPVRRGKSIGLIVGISAVASAALVAVVFAAGSGDAQAKAPAAAPVEIVTSAAVVEVAPPPVQAPVVAPAPVVLDKVKARRLGAIGHRQLRGGNLATAERIFEQSLAANPRCRLALEGLGQIALKRKRYGQAIAHLRGALKVEPRDAANRRRLGDAFSGAGRTAKANEQYAKARAYGDTTTKGQSGGGGSATANPF